MKKILILLLCFITLSIAATNAKNLTFVNFKQLEANGKSLSTLNRQLESFYYFTYHSQPYDANNFALFLYFNGYSFGTSGRINAPQAITVVGGGLTINFPSGQSAYYAGYYPNAYAPPASSYTISTTPSVINTIPISTTAFNE